MNNKACNFNGVDEEELNTAIILNPYIHVSSIRI